MASVSRLVLSEYPGLQTHLLFESTVCHALHCSAPNTLACKTRTQYKTTRAKVWATRISHTYQGHGFIYSKKIQVRLQTPITRSREELMEIATISRAPASVRGYKFVILSAVGCLRILSIVINLNPWKMKQRLVYVLIGDTCIYFHLHFDP